MLFKKETQKISKHCPMEIISYDISPREESRLNPLLKGKNECAPMTPKILQPTGTPFSSFESSGETRTEQRWLVKVDASAHVVPTVILEAITLWRPSYIATLSMFQPCVLPGGAFFIFQGQIIFHFILRKVLSCITAFPWLLQDFILQHQGLDF